MLLCYKIKFKKEIAQSLIKRNYKKQYHYHITLICMHVKLVIIFENSELRNRVSQLYKFTNRETYFLDQDAAVFAIQHYSCF